MRGAAWVLSAVSAVIWGLAGAATWGGVDRPALSIEANAAAALTVLAGLCVIAGSVRDRDKDALVTAWAEVSRRRAPAPTRGDLKRVV